MDSRSPVRALRAVQPRNRDSSHPIGAEGLEIGHRLARRYELLELVADGGTCRIFRARDLESVASGSGDPLVAIKVPHEASAGLAGELVRHEALIARQLNHPGIVRIHDFGRHGAIWFLVMEWVVGTPLGILVHNRRRPLPRHQLRHILNNVADALGHAHARGIVHGDVKPGNILVDEHGSARLLDWTTARYVAGRERAPLSAMTAPVFEGFSPAYASPQAQLGAPAAPTDDVYSLACVAHRLLTGRTPNDADGPPPRRPGAPTTAAAMSIVARGIDPDPARRHRTPTAFANALDEAWARPRRFAVLTLSACLAAALTIPAYIALEQLRADRQALEHHREAREQSAGVLTRLAGTDPERLPAMLQSTAAFDEPWRSYLLRHMRRPVLDRVEAHVSSELTSVHSSATLGALQSLLSSAVDHYPDSARLADLALRLDTARRRHRNALVDDYRTLWAETDFSTAEADRIATMASKIRSAEMDPGALVPKSARNRYANRVREALGVGRLEQVVALDSFRRGTGVGTLRMDPSTQGRLQAARELAAYRQGDAATDRFPHHAAAEFFEPHFNSLRERMESTWSTPPLISVKRRLDELNTWLPTEFEPLRSLRAGLAERLRIKSRYYAGIGNRRRAGYYDGLARELSGQH